MLEIHESRVSKVERLFNSSIVKESNVYDRTIDQYIDEKNKLAQLLESERIKEQIRTYEHNAWEY